MNSYHVRFLGRRKNAIGKMQRISEVMEVPDGMTFLDVFCDKYQDEVRLVVDNHYYGSVWEYLKEQGNDIA